MAGLNGQLSELKIESTYLAEMIPISIYKPPHYTPLKSYRLLICQDGQDYFRLGRIPRQAEALMEEGDIDEAVIVGVPYPSVPTRRKWYHPEGEDAKNYRRFLACELLPFLEQEMSTEPLPEARILAGIPLLQPCRCKRRLNIQTFSEKWCSILPLFLSEYLNK